MRLPSYRESLGRRHHPYTQQRRVRRMDMFIMAADAAEGTGEAYEDAEQGQGVLGEGEDRSDVAEHGSQEDLANLERVLFEENAETPRGLAAVVVELALYVTRALRRLCAP